MNLDKKVRVGSMFALYGALLTDNQREIVNLYYNLDISLGEIGEQFGISRQGVRDTLLRSEAKLNEFEDSLQLMSKKQYLTSRLSAIAEKADEESAEALRKLLEELNGI